MPSETHPHVVSLTDVPAIESSKGTLFASRRKQLGAAANGRALGCSHLELPPGKAAWPLHWHAANEEAVFVLEGEGTLRIGEAKVPLRAGDYVAFPAGPGAAHQIINAGTAPLRYLCFSTMVSPEVAVYPESNKVGVMVGSAPGGSKKERTLEGVFLRADGVDYWEGEDVDGDRGSAPR